MSEAHEDEYDATFSGTEPVTGDDVGSRTGPPAVTATIPRTWAAAASGSGASPAVSR